QLDARVQHLEVTNQQLDSKVQHLSILNQKYEHELALFKQHKFGSKNEHLTAKQIHLWDRSEEHTSELQSRENLVCRLLLEKKKKRSTTSGNGPTETTASAGKRS